MRVMRRFTRWLRGLTMRFRLTSVFLVMLLFGIAVVILGLSINGKVPLIRIQFFPDDYKLNYVDLVGPGSTPIRQVNERVKQISEEVMKDGPGMAKSASGFAGLYFNEDYEPIDGNNNGSVVVTMPSLNDQTFDDPLVHLERMREKLKPLFETDGYKLHIHPQSDGPPTGKDINVRVLGGNLESVSGLAAELLDFMREDPRIGPNLVDLTDDRGQPKRVFRLQVMQDRVAEYGLDNSQVTQLAASVLDGRYLGKHRHIDEEVDLKLYIDPASLREPENALYIPVIEHADRSIYLADLVQVSTYNEPGEINRYQGQQAISLKANIKAGAPTSTPAVVNAVKEHYATIRERYPGATVTFGGEHEDTQRSFESLGYAFIIAVLVMCVILATQFQSYVQPWIILSAIVIALIGVVFSKLLTQSLFTINSFIAVIGVAGEGVHIRLRPILLTTLTTTLGLLPMAIGFPNYSLVWGTMASTFVTGLTTATLLTLFIVPALWDLVMGLQERHARRTGGNTE